MDEAKRTYLYLSLAAVASSSQEVLRAASALRDDPSETETDFRETLSTVESLLTEFLSTHTRTSRSLTSFRVKRV